MITPLINAINLLQKGEHLMKYQIGSILKQSRKNKKLSVEDVAYFLHKNDVSVSTKTIYGWENDFAYPSINNFLLLCKLYKIDNLNTFSTKS